MSDTLTTLLKGLAEALAPHLPGGSEDIDVDDAVQNYVDANFDFEDMVSDAIGDIDWDNHEILTQRNFDSTDFDLVSESDYSFDEFVTSEDVRDMVTEELQQTGAVVTRDNILSVLAAALRASDEARAAA
tara:strand:- start:29 stop:418 length:390 start_codon:yes stop_codon:yes gene_type:complete